MNAFEYFLVSINIFALGWMLYKLHSIGNNINTNYIQLDSKLKRVEQTLLTELNILKGSFAKTSNKLDGAIYKLDNLKKILSNIESQSISIHTEEQRSIELTNEFISRVNTQLSQSVQSIMSKFKNVSNSNATLNQLMRDTLDKTTQIGYGIDAISSIQTNNQRILVDKIDKIKKTEEIGFQQVHTSLGLLQEEIRKQENLLKPLEKLIFELTDLYASLEETIEIIHLEEKSISSMANKHEALIDSVKKLNQTSIDVFEILKLYILNCSLSPFEKNLTKRSR